MLMKLLVNNKETELTQGHTIAALAQQLELPKQGVAIALHNRMVPRAEWENTALNAEWENTALNEGDSLVIIKAACGG